MTTPVSKGTDRPPAKTPASGPLRADWGVYREGVRLVALRALGDVTLADDVAQEAIARAVARLGEMPEDAVRDLGAFVHGIARHVIADLHRARGRTTSIDAVAEPEEPRIDALSSVIREEERSGVRAALEQLSPGDRHVLYLSYYEGLRPEEIAERTRESSGRIRKRKSRALERLRRAFHGDASR